LMHWATH